MLKLRKNVLKSALILSRHLHLRHIIDVTRVWCGCQGNGSGCSAMDSAAAAVRSNLQQYNMLHADLMVCNQHLQVKVIQCVYLLHSMKAISKPVC